MGYYFNREDILNGAKDCVCRSREADYSSPENSFTAIANLWTSYLDAAFPDEKVLLT